MMNTAAAIIGIDHKKAVGILGINDAVINSNPLTALEYPPER
jgi:hypothetical protein